MQKTITNPSFLLCILLFFLVIASSCEKENDTRASKHELLTSHKWKLTSSHSTGTFNYLGLDECEKDNRYHYEKNGIYRYTGGALKCSAERDDFEGTWTLKNTATGSLELIIEEDIDFIYNNDTTQLHISTTYTIDKLTSDKLEMKYFSINTNNIYYAFEPAD